MPTYLQRLARRTANSNKNAGNFFKKVGEGINNTFFTKNSYLKQGLKAVDTGARNLFGAFDPAVKTIGGALKKGLDTASTVAKNPLVQAGLTMVAPEIGIPLASLQSGLAKTNNVISQGQNALGNVKSLTNTDLYKTQASAQNQLEKIKGTGDAFRGFSNAIRQPHNQLVASVSGPVMDYMPPRLAM